MPIAALVTATIVFAVWALVFHHHNLAVFIVGHYAEMLALLPALTMLGLLSVVVTIDAYIRPDLKRIMRLIIAVVFSVVIRDHLEYRLMIGEPRPQLRTLVAIYGYVVRPVVLVLFMRMIVSQKRLWWAWALVGVNATVYLTALFSDVCFHISHDNHYIGGPLSDTAFYIGAMLLIGYIVMAIRVFEPKTRRETWLPVLMFELIIGALALDFNTYDFDYPINYLTIAVVIDCVINYIWLHLKFVREHEQALQAEQRIQIMMTQIKPHFLYNSLTVIQELCRSDPAQAEAATVQFANYLRGNMDALQTNTPIPFGQELEHTRQYLALEEMRFEDKLTVRYDIQCESFVLPNLTLQPIVENAVRHGVRGNADGRGEVVIATRETPDRYEITVKDNGPGFDPEKQPKDQGSSHVGIQNVRQRLAQMCGGELKIESIPGAGTCVTIALPKEENRR
jgi:two-component sensor histidine kinase